jgi:pyruvate kinase
MNKTKIICTIGPATESYDMLTQLYEAGMNIVRLNMSHGDHEWHANVIKRVKTLNQKAKFPVPVLLDTQGPEIRTGILADDLNLQSGQEITVSVRGSSDVEQTSIHVDYTDLVETVKEGDKITVDNGLINLEVLAKEEFTMRCRVIDGGVLKSKRHVNLPGIRVNLPAITAKDERDILFGLEHDVDFIALSFVREASDVRQLKQLMGAKAGKTKIIAKIEDQEGVKNLDEIIEEADGIMVARGDLGVEIQVEQMPIVQRQIIQKCAERGRRVIVATHLLESMIDNPIPTRAEVTDVANAIYEEADAIMLSGETTIGKYPLRAVEHLVKIARTVEAKPGLQFTKNLVARTDKQHLAIAAAQLAEDMQVRGLVVITRRGVMADYLTNCHPRNASIYAFTNVNQARRTMILNRNVHPFRITFSDDPEKTLQNAFQLLKTREEFASGEKVVVLSDVLAGEGKIDAIQIRYLP